MQRRLSITSTCVDQRRIGADELFQLFQHPQSSRRMDGDNRATFGSMGGHGRRSKIEQSETARLPVTSGIDVSSSVEHGIEHRRAANMVDQWRAKVANRIIDSCLERWILLQYSAKSPGVVITKCLSGQSDSLIHRGSGRIHMLFQLCPAIKAVFAGDELLRVREFRLGLQFERAEPCHGLRLFLLVALQKRFGLLA